MRTKPVNIIEMQQIVDKIGAAQNNPWEQFKFSGFVKHTSSHLYIKINRLKNNDEITTTYSSIKRDHNPFKLKNGLPNEFIIEQVNKIGESFSNPAHHYQFSHFGKRDSRNIHVFIKNMKTNEIKEQRYGRLTKGQNPFVQKTNYTDSFIKDQINEAGKSHVIPYHRYEFVRDTKTRSTYTVKNLITKELKNIKFYTIKSGISPFANHYYILGSEIKEQFKKHYPQFKDLKISGNNYPYKKDTIYILNNHFNISYRGPKFNKRITVSGFKARNFLNGQSISEKPSDVESNYIEYVNTFGSSFSSRYEKFEFQSFGKKLPKTIEVYVKNTTTNEVLKTSLDSLKKKSNPFKLRSHLSDMYIKEMVNAQGKISKEKREQYRFKKIINRENTQITLEIENLYSKETQQTRYDALIHLKQNPFNKNNYTPVKLMIKEINKMGAKPKNRNEKYEFLKFKSKNHTQANDPLIIINQNSNEKKTSSYMNLVINEMNPFNQKSKLSTEFIRDETNRIGQNQTPENQFVFVRRYKDSPKENNNFKVLIQNLMTKKVMATNYNSLTRFEHSPFSPTKDLDEVKNAQPKVLKLLKQLNFKRIEKEVRVSPNSQIDFICTTHADKIIFIEVKSDKKTHTQTSIKKQILKYDQDGYKKYTNMFIKTILVSPNGTYGSCLKTLKSELDLLLK